MLLAVLLSPKFFSVCQPLKFSIISFSLKGRPGQTESAQCSSYVSTGLRKRTNALTHFITRRRNTENEETHIRVLHALLQYGADARAPALYKLTPRVEGEEIYPKEQILSAASGQSLMAFRITFNALIASIVPKDDGPDSDPPSRNSTSTLCLTGTFKLISHLLWAPCSPSGSTSTSLSGSFWNTIIGGLLQCFRIPMGSSNTRAFDQLFV